MFGVPVWLYLLGDCADGAGIILTRHNNSSSFSYGHSPITTINPFSSSSSSYGASPSSWWLFWCGWDRLTRLDSAVKFLFSYR